jgi:co-chaperonin GroES (HSP10)
MINPAQLENGKDEVAEEYKKATQLPEPQGYHILCALPDIEDKYESGLYKTEKAQETEEILATVLFVVALGPDCYQDTNKFPTGAWCKEGDFVLVRPHTGTRLHIHGKSFRIINDDSVEAVVEDPRGIERQ